MWLLFLPFMDKAWNVWSTLLEIQYKIWLTLIDLQLGCLDAAAAQWQNEQAEDIETYRYRYEK